MRFSIIIPAYNSARYITRALQSIQSQTFKDYELIVVCDSCKDDTAKVAKRYGAKVFNEKYGNDGLSRSKGIDEAVGEYVLFMDDDDWWLHEYVLEMLDNKLKEIGRVDVLCFSFIFKGVGYATPRQPEGSHWIAVWNKCWKRSAIGKTRFPEVYSISDRFFDAAMKEKNLVYYDWDMPLYYYNYLRRGSISDKMGRDCESLIKWLRGER